MVTILQTLGVQPLQALRYAQAVANDKHPTFVEAGGMGNIVRKMAARAKRSIIVEGLSAMDLRTTKVSGEPWDFMTSSDSAEALRMV